MYAKVTNIKFPPAVRTDMVRVAQGLAPVLKDQRGFESLQVLTDPNGDEGIILSLGDTEADAEARSQLAV